MNIADFIKEYEARKNNDTKNALIEKHILKDKYVNYENKIDLCKRIADTANHVMVDGKKMFQKSSTNQYMLYMMTLMNQYTDLNCTISGANTVSDFNLLDKNNLFETFTSKMPATEIAKFDVIMEMVMDDMIENERNVVSVMNNMSFGNDELMKSLQKLKTQKFEFSARK